MSISEVRYIRTYRVPRFRAGHSLVASLLTRTRAYPFLRRPIAGQHLSEYRHPLPGSILSAENGLGKGPANADLWVVPRHGHLSLWMIVIGALIGEERGVRDDAEAVGETRRNIQLVSVVLGQDRTRSIVRNVASRPLRRPQHQTLLRPRRTRACPGHAGAGDAGHAACRDWTSRRYLVRKTPRYPPRRSECQTNSRRRSLERR